MPVLAAIALELQQLDFIATAHLPHLPVSGTTTSCTHLAENSFQSLGLYTTDPFTERVRKTKEPSSVLWDRKVPRSSF